jgi:DNA-binding GntR family transcriptional regulator
MATRASSVTRSVVVHEKLRADILSGRLAPGEHLKSAVLCTRYETSVGALREAFSKLSDEGLVITRPFQGYMVTPLSMEDLADLTDARVEIEALVLRMSIEHGDVHWEAQSGAALHVLERAPFIGADDPDRPSDEWATAHTAFHFALLEGCPNRHLLQVARKLRQEAGLYQMWSVSFKHEPERDGTIEHRALLDAAIARDANLASRLLAEHLRHTANLLIDIPEAPSGSDSPD